jgi:hypothetical protein
MLALAQLQTGRGTAEIVLPLPGPSHATLRRRWGPLAIAAVVLLAMGSLGTWWRGRSAAGAAPFQVVGTRGPVRPFTNLVAAIEAQRAGDVLEFNWDGARTLSPIVVSNRALHLRARKGRHPILINRSREEPWLITDAPLRIEGLELRAARADGDMAISGRPAQFARPLTDGRRQSVDRSLSFVLSQQLLVVRGAPVTLVNCRLVSSAIGQNGQQPVLLIASPRAEFQNCEFFHLGGPAVSWDARVSGNEGALPAVVKLTNCVVMARAALYTWMDKAPARLEIQNSTIVGLFVVSPLGSVEALSVDTVSNVFTLRRPFSAPAALAWAARDRWHGKGNVYSRNAPDVNFELPPVEQDSKVLPLAITDRIRDKAGTGQRLTPADFGLAAEERSTLGHSAGAALEHVGPRAVLAAGK